jgi:hypothetical protein
MWGVWTSDTCVEHAFAASEDVSKSCIRSVVSRSELPSQAHDTTNSLSVLCYEASISQSAKRFLFEPSKIDVGYTIRHLVQPLQAHHECFKEFFLSAFRNIPVS